MTEAINASALKEKFNEIKSNFPENVHLRIGRAISWTERAEVEAHDADVRVIFLWIAFNAAYAREIEGELTKHSARTDLHAYFEKLVASDQENRIYNALMEKFSGPIRVLMQNEFIYKDFWNHHNGIEGYEDWKDRFKRENTRFHRAFEMGQCAKVLDGVFKRLYVLRNQLVHGGATWNSERNRDQVRDGAAILDFLIPIFVDIMMDNPDEDWGKPFYPRVPESERRFPKSR